MIFEFYVEYIIHHRIFKVEMIIMMYNENIETVNMSNLPIIYQLCRMAKIMEMVNAMVSWRDDNSKITPGFLIETMVICILSSRKATWKIHEYWTQQDLDFFYPELNLLVSQLNDDAYVRALDKLAEVKVEELISKICLTMLKLHDLNIETLHLDTTSKSVQGAYEEDANRALSEFTESIKKSGFEYAIEIKEVSETVYNKKVDLRKMK